jgi:adenine-specific DNA-methyltransferase
MSKNTKLELTWIGKDQRPKLEPRILLEDPDESYHAPGRVTDDDSYDNRLIHGDNLLALKSLEQEFAGKIKCVYIDPPYNTGSAFTHYDDGVEHSLWLSLMRDRLELIRALMADDGSLWITIDDNECHYLKVLCDEIFGRQNFIANVIWQKMFAPKSSARHLSASHDHILVFAKDGIKWQRNLQPRTATQDDRYKNLDDDARGPWISDQLTARNYYSRGLYPVTCPSGRVIEGPPKGRYWAISPERFKELDAEHRIWWGKDGDNMPRLKRFLTDVQEGVVPQTIWLHTEVGNTQEAKKEVLPYASAVEDVFTTPKPERLVSRILQIASAPGDWVLDSFAGSGTTGAVAHKMGRRWIMAELGEHCRTHILPRLRKVVDGQDHGGITNAVGWKGGGGFRFYRLAPSLLEKDRWDNWVISKQYNATMLAEAMCKMEGFIYAPSPDRWWQHGHSTERDFIYVTTQKLTQQQLHALSEEVGTERSLLVSCTAFRGAADQFQNLNLKKIPKAVMDRCEWGRDDYSLSITNLPPAAVEDADAPPSATSVKKSGRARKTKVEGQSDLFATAGTEQGGSQA